MSTTNALAGKVASLLPPRNDMTAADLIRLADSLIGVAMRIAGIVHDEDPKEACELVDGLDDEHRWALPYVLAAMVDVEKSARELLGWAPFTVPVRYEGATSLAPETLLLRDRPRRNQINECGTESAWQQHVARGEDPDHRCWIAHRAWDADTNGRNRQDTLPGFEDVLPGLGDVTEVRNVA